jgi:hypothetical protein
MVGYAGIYLGMDGTFFIGLPDSAGDAKALCVTPRDLLPGDTHGIDLVVAPAQTARAGMPRDGLDNEFDGLEAPAVVFGVEVAHADQPFAQRSTSFLVPLWPGRRVSRVSTWR